MSLDTARAERDAGMTQALEHAERVHSRWGDAAYLDLQEYAKRHRTFTSYDFRKDYHARGLPNPPTDKAFGPVFRRAILDGVIVKAGYEQHPERHASPTPLWSSMTVTQP